MTPKWIKSKGEVEEEEGDSEYEDVSEGDSLVELEASTKEVLPAPQPVVAQVVPRVSPPPPAIRRASLDRTVRGMGTGGAYAGAGLGGSSVAMVV